MRYNGVVKEIQSINTFNAEIDLGFKVQVNVTLRLLNISSLKNNDKIDEAVKYLETKLVNKEVELDIKLAKEHSLAIIYLDGENVNQDILDKGLAKVFKK